MIDADETRVLDLVDDDALIELTATLVRCPGENPPGDELATATALADAARGMGLAVELDEAAPDRPNVTATLAGRSDAGGLLLLGHTDVVPVGARWTRDPFGAEIADGRLHGRGSTDMKGGLAASLIAMDALRRSGVALTGPVALAAAVDEEETGLGIRRYVAQLARTPQRFRHCLVAEPTDLQPIVAARGDSYVRIDVTGRASHSGTAALGRNAIHGAAAIIAALQADHAELAAAAHPLVGPGAWSVGTIEGGMGVSTVPAFTRLQADRRLLPGEDAAAVLSGVRERIDGLGLSAPGSDLGVEITMTMDMPGFETAPDADLVRAVDSSIRDAGGPGLPLAGWGAACDGGFLARDLGLDVVVLGPGSVENQAHRADESVGLDELKVAARTYVLTALRLLGSGRG